MSYAINNHNFAYWKELLQNMWEGHTSSGVALRDDLRDALAQAKTDFAERVNAYTTLRARERHARREAADLQEQGQQAFRKVKYNFISEAPQESRDLALQLYHLHLPVPRRRLAVLDRLQKIVEVAGQQTEATLKPLASLVADISALAANLRKKIDESIALKADIEESKRALRAAMQENAELRERIYAYLVLQLAGGSQDPKLIDFGLREKFRVRGRPVTVVEEVQPEPAPEPQPQPNPAP